MTGMMIKSAMTPTVRLMSSQRTIHGSWRVRLPAPPTSTVISPIDPLAPSADIVDDSEHCEGGSQKDDGDCGGLGVLILFKSGNNQHRSDLSLVRHVARDE